MWGPAEEAPGEVWPGKFRDSTVWERKQAFGTRSSSHKQFSHLTQAGRRSRLDHIYIPATFEKHFAVKTSQSLHTFRDVFRNGSNPVHLAARELQCSGHTCKIRPITLIWRPQF